MRSCVARVLRWCDGLWVCLRTPFGGSESVRPAHGVTIRHCGHTQTLMHAPHAACTCQHSVLPRLAHHTCPPGRPSHHVSQHLTQPQLTCTPRHSALPMAQQLWASAVAADWQAVHEAYADTLAQQTPPQLQALNRWYEQELPAALRSRAPHPHITQPELVKLVDWKLKRGKFRPRLLGYAQEAQDSAVKEASTRALAALLPTATSSPAAAQPPAANVQAALAALVALKGVGPATASAVLSAAHASCPFMSDEALNAAVGSRSYTAKEYLELLAACRAKAAALAQQDAGTGWSAVLVERCLYAAELARKAAATGAAAGGGGRPSAGKRKAAAPAAAGGGKKPAASRKGAAAAGSGGGGGGAATGGGDSGQPQPAGARRQTGAADAETPKAKGGARH